MTSQELILKLLKSENLAEFSRYNFGRDLARMDWRDTGSDDSLCKLDKDTAEYDGYIYEMKLLEHEDVRSV